MKQIREELKELPDHSLAWDRRGILAVLDEIDKNTQSLKKLTTRVQVLEDMVETSKKIVVEKAEISSDSIPIESIIPHKLESNNGIKILEVDSGHLDAKDILVESGLVLSRSEAARMIKQGAVGFNGSKLAYTADVINTHGTHHLSILSCGRRMAILRRLAK